MNTFLSVSVLFVVLSFLIKETKHLQIAIFAALLILGVNYYLDNKTIPSPDAPILIFQNGGKQITFDELFSMQPPAPAPEKKTVNEPVQTIVAEPINTPMDNPSDNPVKKQPFAEFVGYAHMGDDSALIQCAFSPLDEYLELNGNSTIFKRMEQLNRAAACFANAVGIDPLFFIAMIGIESNFNHRAVSSVGALGLTQVMPATAAANCATDRPHHVYLAIKSGNDINRKDFLNKPYKQLYCGAHYLKKRLGQAKKNQYKVYPFVNQSIVPYEYAIAVCAYNAGWGRIEQYNGCPPFKETRNHLVNFQRVIERYNRFGGKMPAASELGLG
jgi:hypothetical protein